MKLFYVLQVSHLTHSVLSQNGFKAEYKKPGGMLKLASCGRLNIGEGLSRRGEGETIYPTILKLLKS